LSAKSEIVAQIAFGWIKKIKVTMSAKSEIVEQIPFGWI